MSAKPTHDNSVNADDNGYDDLTLIKGIGPARQKWLRESLSIRKYQDLAGLTVDKVEAKLKADGQIASRAEIEQWILRASEHATEATLAEEQSAANAKPETGTDDETAGDESTMLAEKSVWTPFASFVVEFEARTVDNQIREQRTKVHHVEKDANGTLLGGTWSGIACEQICQWIRKQLEGEGQPEPDQEQPEGATSNPVSPVELPPVATVPVAGPLATIAISQIRAFQPPDAKKPVGSANAGRPFQGIIKGDQPLAFEIVFEPKHWASDPAGLADNQSTYNAQFHIRSLITGENIQLSEVESTLALATETIYTAKSSAVTLSPGIYRLQVPLILRNKSPYTGYFEVPLLHVI